MRNFPEGPTQIQGYLLQKHTLPSLVQTQPQVGVTLTKTCGLRQQSKEMDLEAGKMQDQYNAAAGQLASWIRTRLYLLRLRH